MKKQPNPFSLVAASLLFALAGSVGGGTACAQDGDPVAEEAKAPPKLLTHEEALAEAVQDGDLPRLEQLLADSPHPESAAALAHTLTARPHIGYCGMDSNLPRVPWSRERFLPVFQRLLRAVTAVDFAKGEEGESLLMAAAALGDLESVRYLVGRGAQLQSQVPIHTVTVGYPEPTKVGGTSPLLEAVRSGFDDENPDPGPLVAYLLREGVEVNAADARGGTALLTASGSGNIGAVRMLLAAGADANLRADDGQSCLDWARRQKKREIAALLAPLTDMTLTEASAMNDAGAVRRLLEGGVPVNLAHVRSGETALMAAAQADATDAATVLLERGAEVGRTDREGKNALHLAVEEGNVAAVNLLLDHKADPDAPPVGKDDKGNITRDEWLESEFPLTLAIRGGHVPVVEALLRHGAHFDTPERTSTVARTFALATGRDGGEGTPPPLTRADMNRLLDLLIGAGLSLREGPVAVYAAQYAPPELLQTLLDRGASPDARVVGKTDEDEQTALMATISRVWEARDEEQHLQDAGISQETNARGERNARACFRLLLRRGARVDAATKTGATAFTGAVAFHCFDMADELRRRGANIDAADKTGRTALHRAVSQTEYADEAALRYLIKHRANRSLRDKKGDTALALARKHGLKNAVAMLTKR